MANIKRIDIFPHSGSTIPAEIQKLIRTDLTPEQISNTIEVNRDSGLERVIQSYVTNPEPGQLVITYDYPRVITDVNRLEPLHQVPETPYLGEKLIDYNDEIRQNLINKFIKPWQLSLLQIIKENPEAVIVHWHSMDTHSVGTPTGSNFVVNEKTLRPMGQLLSRADTHRDSLANYQLSELPEVIETEFVNAEIMQSLLDIFTNHLQRHAEFAEMDEFMADNPYKLYGEQDGKRLYGPVLNGLITAHNLKNKQLTFDIRKDVAQHPESVTSMRKAVTAAIELLNHP